ncbi:MAG: glycerol-3-phosphate dehydrogenase, partial [Sulfitobacter sp.]|nr:glycerol-3-phosphate dehydrogenase [Sulfitobacter sp.]
RRLAETALEKINAFFPETTGPWTAGVPLPGGDFPVDGVADLTARLASQFHFLTPAWTTRLIKAYGTDAFEVLGDATSEADLGQNFGSNLTAREVLWLIKNEFARKAEDVVWRRSKLGLRMTAKEIEKLDVWMAGNAPQTTSDTQPPLRKGRG